MSARDEGASRLRLAAARTLERAAGGAQGYAARAAEAGGPSGRAAPLARQVGRRFDSMAGYLRSNETEQIIGDLEAAIRRRPIRALTAAFLAGYLTRRVF